MVATTACNLLLALKLVQFEATGWTIACILLAAFVSFAGQYCSTIPCSLLADPAHETSHLGSYMVAFLQHNHFLVGTMAWVMTDDIAIKATIAMMTLIFVLLILFIDYLFNRDFIQKLISN